MEVKILTKKEYKKYGNYQAVEGTDYAIMTGLVTPENWASLYPFGSDPQTRMTRQNYRMGNYLSYYTLPKMYWEKYKIPDGIMMIMIHSTNLSHSPELKGYDSRIGGFRPAITFTKEEYAALQKGPNGKVQFGFYPKNAPSKKMQDKLKTETLEQTPFCHKNNRAVLIENDQYEPELLPVYEYDGKYYIRISPVPFGPKYNTRPALLSNGIEYGPSDEAFIEVEPITWLCDDETCTIVSTHIIAASTTLEAKYPYEFIAQFEREILQYMSNTYAYQVKEKEKPIVSAEESIDPALLAKKGELSLIIQNAATQKDALLKQKSKLEADLRDQEKAQAEIQRQIADTEKLLASLRKKETENTILGQTTAEKIATVISGIESIEAAQTEATTALSQLEETLTSEENNLKK